MLPPSLLPSQSTYGRTKRTRRLSNRILGQRAGSQQYQTQISGRSGLHQAAHGDIPDDALEDVPKVEDYKQIILTLKDLPIVNFTGISNTELKLRYGAPNIDLLTQYDQNYTLLVRTLQQWAQLLYDAGYLTEACQMLEFAVSTGTDISSTYRLLCRIYKEQHTPEKIGSLYPIAEVLNSAMQKTIVRILQEADQSAD